VNIATLASLHDGMGVLRLPVSSGHRFSARVLLPSGEERSYELPVPSDTGVGVTVTMQDSLLLYRVIKGELARLPDDLYVFVHSAGRMMGVEYVDRLFKGQMDLTLFPEGIAHILLVDGQGVVYSERLFFVRKKERPRVEIVPDKSVYAARGQVMLDLDFAPPFREEKGTFSITVTDDSQVPVDSLEDNILTNLLLTSELKGYIHDPAYYFSESPEAGRDLDLVMMTHGWRRFDVATITRGERRPSPYPIERGQVISGKVNNFWGKKSKMANVILLSTSGIVQMGETDDAGNFLIDVAFPDSTQFVLQALSEKGRRSVSVSVDRDPFLPPCYTLPRALEVKPEEREIVSRQIGQNFYYENGQKVYILDEVTVVRKRQRKYHSFYDQQARFHADSATIAGMHAFGVPELIQQLFPGVLVERDENGEEYFSYYNRKLYIQANDFEESMDFVRTLHPDALLGISMLDERQGFMYFGTRAEGGALIISYKFGFVPLSPGRPNIVPFSLLGYQREARFYVPRYDVDSIRVAKNFDSRRTIYWNPVVTLVPGEEKKQLSFYTADTPGNYSVILEGITSAGRVCRERRRLIVK
jgi:hypothetical protein